MGEQEPGLVLPDPTQDDESALHVASGDDETEARQRTDRLAEILDRWDSRDRSAERRDRAAEGREPHEPYGAGIDREWSRRDRDRVAEDRADLIELLRSQELTAPRDTEDLP